MSAWGAAMGGRSEALCGRGQGAGFGGPLRVGTEQARRVRPGLGGSQDAQRQPGPWAGRAAGFHHSPPPQAEQAAKGRPSGSSAGVSGIAAARS